MIRPTLSICIPTFNRASFLKLTLENLQKELIASIESQLEIIVSDNCSEDNTYETAMAMIDNGLALRYVRNVENIGSDRNIAQCFNLARGQYVLLLSDDDLLVRGALNWVLSEVNNAEYGVIFLRQYGYDKNHLTERPGQSGTVESFTDAGKFLIRIGASSTLISSNVINKKLLGEIDANQFCGTNLVQLHLILRAALIAKQNLYNGRYSVACKRNNTGGYDFSIVFVNNFLKILDQYNDSGLKKKTVRAIENRMLIGYYPFPLWQQLLNRKLNIESARNLFSKRFSGRWAFMIFVAPTIYLPRPLAILWGTIAISLGRAVTGDARRGMYFALNKVRYLTQLSWLRIMS